MDVLEFAERRDAESELPLDINTSGEKKR